MTALRAMAVYAFVLAVVRLLGKRSVGNLSAFDLIVALMLGEVVDEIVFGDVTLVKGFLAVAVIAFCHFVNAWASYRSKLVDWLTAGAPRVLVLNGKIQEDALARERMNEDELWSELRRQSIDDLKEVKKAILEPSGQVSVIQQDWAKPLQKGDLQSAKGRAA
jgi:uncharacterized membrane protein YcaP (DUF421 family)